MATGLNTTHLSALEEIIHPSNSHVASAPQNDGIRTLSLNKIIGQITRETKERIEDSVESK